MATPKHQLSKFLLCYVYGGIVNLLTAAAAHARCSRFGMDWIESSKRTLEKL